MILTGLSHPVCKTLYSWEHHYEMISSVKSNIEQMWQKLNHKVIIQEQLQSLEKDDMNLLESGRVENVETLLGIRCSFPRFLCVGRIYRVGRRLWLLDPELELT